jgi:hypothetical protein
LVSVVDPIAGFDPSKSIQRLRQLPHALFLKMRDEQEFYFCDIDIYIQARIKLLRKVLLITFLRRMRHREFTSGCPSAFAPLFNRT